VKPVELAPEAARELADAVEYLEAHRPGTGDDFEREVRAALDLIGKQPKAFTFYRDRYRRVVNKRFGYVIYYVEFDDHVWVATITHGKRDPDHWLNREPK